MKPSYALLEHTADVAVKFWAPTLKELFITAGQTLFDLICGLDTISPVATRYIEVHIPDHQSGEDLLVRWLSELLYLFDVDGLVFREFNKVHLDNTSITSEVSGEELDLGRHEVITNIKAITYHQLAIKQNEQGLFEATVVMDV